MNISRTVLHHVDATSDKVYIVDVNKLDNKTAGSTPYALVVSWGKRIAPRLSSQIKELYGSEYTAIEAARAVVRNKQRGKDKYSIVATNKIEIAGLKHLGVANIANVYSSNKIPNDNKVAIQFTDTEVERRSIKV